MGITFGDFFLSYRYRNSGLSVVPFSGEHTNASSHHSVGELIFLPSNITGRGKTARHAGEHHVN